MNIQTLIIQNSLLQLQNKHLNEHIVKEQRKSNPHSILHTLSNEFHISKKDTYNYMPKREWEIDAAIYSLGNGSF